MPLALDTFVAEYEGDTLTLDIKDEIMDALYEVDGTIDYDAYEQDLVKLLEKDIKEGKSVEAFGEDAKALVTKEISALMSHTVNCVKTTYGQRVTMTNCM